MKKLYVLLITFFSVITSFTQNNLIRNSDFSNSNSDWITTGSFNYNVCTTIPCELDNPYAYTSPNCNNTNDASGTLSQDIIIPTNCTGGTFTFKHRTGTTNTFSAVDFLNVNLIAIDQTIQPIQLSNLNFSPDFCFQIPPVDITSFLVQHKGQKITLKFYSVQSVDNTITVFRIDDVSLIVTLDNVGTTGCVNWANDAKPADINVFNAAEELCKEGIINSNLDLSTFPNYSVQDAAQYTLSSLYEGLTKIPLSLPSDYFPSMFTDIDNLSSNYLHAIKAMTFLEYGDGISCINRNYYCIQPTNAISLGNILRMVLEAYNIAPDINGYDGFSHTSSSFFCNIYSDDNNYGYFQKAFELHLLDGYYSGCSFQSQITPGEFFLLMLQRVHSQYQYLHPSINNVSFYTPNNLKLTSQSNDRGISKGYFETYEQDGFNIPSSGIGLHFGYNYHSDLTEQPLLNSEVLAGSLAMESTKELLYPLGIGWTHTYNIYAQPVSDNNGNEPYLVIHWGDGETDIFDPIANRYVTSGVYDISTAILDNNKVQILDVRTKDQLVYQFKRDGALLLLQSITDRNNNLLQFNYEPSVCGQSGYGDIGSSKRLLQVVDFVGGRYLQFSYQQGTDLLRQISDNTGRNILFDVNKESLTLNAVTNQVNGTTHYSYYLDNSSKNLLYSIIRPKGNSITNLYDHKKLTHTSTNEYSAAVTFTPDYTNSNNSTQTTVTVTPSTGITYTTAYTYTTYGNIVIAKDSISNTTYVYGDPNNPTLPTIIRNEYDNLAEVFEYDGIGNIKRHSRQGRNEDDVEEYFTYDQANNIKTHIWPNGTTINCEYDNNFNLTKETGPLGYNKTYTRDALGRIQAISDGTTQTNLGYNSYGNLNSISIEGTSISQTAEYDGLSRIKTLTNPKSVITSYTYDPLDNITQVIQDLGGLAITKQYTFDANNNLSTIKDPNQTLIQLFYNNSDDLTKETKGNLLRSWTYNADGTIQQYEDKNIHQFNYSYYPSGDPNEGKLKSNGYQNFVYLDGDKQLQAVQLVQNSPNDINFRYDDLLRIQSESCYTPEFSSTTAYEYDISSNIKKVSLPQDKSLNYNYDALNRISSITDWNNALLVQYSYTSNGRLESETLGNGVMVHYHYDAASRLDSIWSAKSDGTLLHSVGCSLDNVGNHIRESTFVNWTNGYYRQKLSDPHSYTYDLNDHLISLDNVAVNNDHNGNILNNLFHGFTDATYDLHNNLLSCSVDGKIKSFTYDAQENRIGDDNMQFVLDYVNNSNVLAIQQKGSSEYQQFYAYSPYGMVCSIDPNTNAKTYYLYDFRGSTIALVDDNQNLTQYYKYAPFGEITESSDLNKTATPFLFVGKYGVMYESPHLYYMRARYYDPTIGRFQGEDRNWSTNLFNYGDNNPLSNIDPQGQISVDAGAFGFEYSSSSTSIGKLAGATAAIGLLAYEIQNIIKDESQRTYITYNLTNSTNGKIYFGRSSGFGTPQQILAKRYAGHDMAEIGYINPTLDKYMTGFPVGYSAIRGREQMLVDSYGGIYFRNSNPRLGNTINPISKFNTFRGIYINAAKDAFGAIQPQ